MTYSLALYTCAKVEEKQTHFSKAYQNIERASKIMVRLLGEEAVVTKKYFSF